MPLTEDPRYALLGMPDMASIGEAERFYNSLPDTAFLQARGIMPMPQTPFAPTDEGYVDPFGPQAVNDPYQQMRGYEDTILGGLKGLDVTAPDYQTKLQEFFDNHPDPSASELPRVRSAVGSSLQSHKTLNSIFQRSPKLRGYFKDLAGKMSIDEALPIATQVSLNEPKDPMLRGEYHAAINELIKGKKSVDAEDVSAQLAIKHGLANAGVDPSEFLKDGRIDPTQASLAIARAKVGPPILSPITPSEEKALNEGADELEEAKQFVPTEAQKKPLVDGGKTWDEAHKILVDQGVEKATTKLKRRVSSLKDSNRAVPSDFYKMTGMTPDQFSFNAKGKPVRVAGAGPMDEPVAEVVATPAPVASDSTATAPTAQPKSLYDVPSLEDDKKKGLAASSVQQQKSELRGAVEDALLSHYTNQRKTEVDAAHDLDRLLMDLPHFEMPITGDLDKSRTVLMRKFLDDRGVPVSINSMKALAEILEQRKKSVSGERPTAPAARPNIKSVKLIQP